MAANWSTDTSGSDTETGEESLPENPHVLIQETTAQNDSLLMRNEIVANPPRETEIIVLSSDEETTSHSTSERFSTSYATSSSSMASEASGSSPLFNLPLQTFDPGFFFRGPGEYVPATNLSNSTIERSHTNASAEVLEESSQDVIGSPDLSNIRKAIDERLPAISELTPIEVTLNSNRKITADFPNIAEIISKSPNARENSSCFRWNEDGSLPKKSVKYFSDSPSVFALKRYRVSSISEAIWRPETRLAEVTNRRGKQLESMGSQGNPTFLEFYEALYLMTRVKLRLLSPDMTPMSVFDAYNALMRHTEDSEMYSIYEYLMDSNAIVASFKPPQQNAPTSTVTSSPIVEKKISKQAIPASGGQSSVVSSISAYEKEDSDSDLEVLSCNMPASSKPTEIVLAYEQGIPYQGPEIAFPKLGVSMMRTALQTIPQELLPECRAVHPDASNGKADTRIPVLGGDVFLHPQWFTAEGTEEPDWTDPRVGAPKRTRKRKNVGKSNPRNSPKKRLKIDSQENYHAPNPECSAHQSGDNEPMPERYNRRWFPRWFDGVELGVHSLSIVDTLHKFTADGIPKVDSARCWSDYKNVFAKLVKESRSRGEDNSLYRGTTTPLMTGTKGNQTQLIFGELQLTEEICEPFDMNNCIQISHGPATDSDDPLRKADGCQPCSTSTPRIIFDVYIDSAYSKTKPTTPDYRVVQLKGSSVLKISDFIKLSLEAGDATLLIAHVVDGRVRVRQAMMFSIPRYN